jgi:hypothetical protein
MDMSTKARAAGGLGWPTVGVLNLLWLRLGSNLPAFVAPGLLGEGALTVWLIVKGVAVPAPSKPLADPY